MPTSLNLMDVRAEPLSAPPRTLHPLLAEFVDDVRALLGHDSPIETRFGLIGARFGVLLAEPELVDLSEQFPGFDPTKGPENLLLWSDHSAGFGINALVRAPGQASSIHDHGSTWTIYGVLSGRDQLENFDRIDDNGQLPTQAHLVSRNIVELQARQYDIVPPWAVHQEMGNGTARVVGLIVRSLASGSFVQNRYSNNGACTVTQYHGPRQVPFDLVGMRPLSSGELPWRTTD